MKKIFALIAILVLSFMLVGCGEETPAELETPEAPAEPAAPAEEPTAPEMPAESTSPEIAPEPTPAPEPEAEEPEEKKEPTASSFTIITIKGFTPYPKELTIKAGTTVMWKTEDANIQYVIAWKGFKGMPLVEGQEDVTYTFEDPGEIIWFSTTRPTLQGTITIEE